MVDFSDPVGFRERLIQADHIGDVDDQKGLYQIIKSDAHLLKLFNKTISDEQWVKTHQHLVVDALTNIYGGGKEGLKKIETLVRSLKLKPFNQKNATQMLINSVNNNDTLEAVYILTHASGIDFNGLRVSLKDGSLSEKQFYSLVPYLTIEQLELITDADSLERMTRYLSREQKEEVLGSLELPKQLIFGISQLQETFEEIKSGLREMDETFIIPLGIFIRSFPPDAFIVNLERFQTSLLQHEEDSFKNKINLKFDRFYKEYEKVKIEAEKLMFEVSKAKEI